VARPSVCSSTRKSCSTDVPGPHRATGSSSFTFTTRTTGTGGFVGRPRALFPARRSPFLGFATLRFAAGRGCALTAAVGAGAWLGVARFDGVLPAFFGPATGEVRAARVPELVVRDPPVARSIVLALVRADLSAFFSAIFGARTASGVDSGLPFFRAFDVPMTRETRVGAGSAVRARDAVDALFAIGSGVARFVAGRFAAGLATGVAARDDAGATGSAARGADPRLADRFTGSGGAWRFETVLDLATRPPRPVLIDPCARLMPRKLPEACRSVNIARAPRVSS
jgi:hypothetical protein